MVIGLPEPYATEIEGWRVRLGDPAPAPIPPHITLLPPRPVPAPDLARARAHLAAQAALAHPFTVELKGTGTFRPVSPVSFVAVIDGGGPCARLAAAIRSGPLACALDFDYHPHVTVVHDLEPDVLDRAEVTLADYQATFEARSFQLYVRTASTRWRVADDLPLGGPPAPPASG